MPHSDINRVAAEVSIRWVSPIFCDAGIVNSVGVLDYDTVFDRAENFLRGPTHRAAALQRLVRDNKRRVSLI